MDDGSVLPDVAYLTSAQLGRPFPVRWVEVPDRDAPTTSVRKQFTDGEVTRGKKFEGVCGTDEGVYVVNILRLRRRQTCRPTPSQHDGMVWFYNYRDQTITAGHLLPAPDHVRDRRTPPRYDDVNFDSPDNVTVTPWGTLVLAEDGIGASHVLSSVPGGPTYAIARNKLNIGTRRRRSTPSSPARPSPPTARCSSSTCRTPASRWPSPAPGRSTWAEAIARDVANAPHRPDAEDVRGGHLAGCHGSTARRPPTPPDQPARPHARTAPVGNLIKLRDATSGRRNRGTLVVCRRSFGRKD